MEFLNPLVLSALRDPEQTLSYRKIQTFECNICFELNNCKCNVCIILGLLRSGLLCIVFRRTSASNVFNYKALLASPVRSVAGSEAVRRI